MRDVLIWLLVASVVVIGGGLYAMERDTPGPAYIAAFNAKLNK